MLSIMVSTASRNVLRPASYKKKVFSIFQSHIIPLKSEGAKLPLYKVATLQSGSLAPSNSLARGK